MTETTTFDRLATRLEETTSYYIAHRDRLYRPLTTLAIFTYLVSMAWSISVTAPDFTVLMEVPRVGAWIVAGLIIELLLIALALGVRSRISQKRAAGLTLAALFVVVNVCTFHVFIALLGLYAFYNEKFRGDAREWGPQWYRDLCLKLD